MVSPVRRGWGLATLAAAVAIRAGQGWVAHCAPPGSTRQCPVQFSGGKAQAARLQGGKAQDGVASRVIEVLVIAWARIICTDRDLHRCDAIAMLLEAIEVRFFGHAYLDALVIAILVGVAIRAFWEPGPVWSAGIGFCAKTLLEIAVVLLGASLSAGLIVALGPILLVGIAIIVTVAIASSYALCRALGLPRRCRWASAAIDCATRRLRGRADHRREPEDIASSIAFTEVLASSSCDRSAFVPILDLADAIRRTEGLTFTRCRGAARDLPIARSAQVGTLVKARTRVDARAGRARAFTACRAAA